MLGQQELRAAREAAVTARMAYLINFIGCPLVGGSVELKISIPIFGRHARAQARLIKGKSPFGTASGPIFPPFRALPGQVLLVRWRGHGGSIGQGGGTGWPVGR